MTDNLPGLAAGETTTVCSATEAGTLAGGPPVALGGVRIVLLWLLAVIIAIVGVVQLFQGQVLLAIGLFVVACLIGPGGYSIFRSNKT